MCKEINAILGAQTILIWAYGVDTCPSFAVPFVPGLFPYSLSAVLGANLDLLCLFLIGCSICSRIVPIFSLSAVSGANLDLLMKFLNVIPPLNKDREKLVQGPTEYQVNKSDQSGNSVDPD